ncbi:VanZ family protein [Candidatus Pelagibacter sp. Uisw_127]|uniref:VanZ family protein n=1 Tax=Candidatus Pelagibacter sp. Uisw_127 TaxID=3230988 RepID=UPI0039EAB4BD
MKHIKNLLIPAFHTVNLMLIIFYLYSGSLSGCFIYNNCNTQPQITRDFIISSNHFYAFTILFILGTFAYKGTKKIKFLILYLILLSIILELFHYIIPNRGFQISDLFGNIVGVVFVIIIYKVKDKYV